MIITKGMLTQSANRQLELYSKENAVDQISTDKPFLNWLMSKKKETSGGGFYFREKVRIKYDSNYQNYQNDDQVNYNRRDTIRWTAFSWSSFHDGFGLNEDELAANGITLNDNVDAVEVTDAGTFQLFNLLKENQEVLKLGAQERFNEEMLRDGSYDPKAAQGLDFIVSTTPTVGVVGGIDAATATYWRNTANLNIPTTDARFFLEQLETTWRAVVTYGKSVPDTIFAGSAFIDAYRKALLETSTRTVMIREGGGARGLQSYEGATGDLYFQNVMVQWDPTFDILDTKYGPFTIPWSKRAYFLSSKALVLRPLRGHWMVNRKPDRMYDRYVYYFGLTSKYRLTTNKRNAHAVVSIA